MRGKRFVRRANLNGKPSATTPSHPPGERFPQSNEAHPIQKAGIFESRTIFIADAGLSATAIALALSAGSAFGADLPSRKEAPVYIPPPPPPAALDRLLRRLNIGGGWSANSNNTAICPTPTRPTASAAPRTPAQPEPVLPARRRPDQQQHRRCRRGAQAGYNYQFGSFVIGAERTFRAPA